MISTNSNNLLYSKTFTTVLLGISIIEMVFLGLMYFGTPKQLKDPKILVQPHSNKLQKVKLYYGTDYTFKDIFKVMKKDYCRLIENKVYKTVPIDLYLLDPKTENIEILVPYNLNYSKCNK